MTNLPRKKMNLTLVAKSIIGLGIIVLLCSTVVLYNPQLTKPKVENKILKTKDTKDITLPVALTDPASVTVLVDKKHGLSKEYIPENLTAPYLNSTADVIQLRSDAATSAKAMYDKAKAESIPLFFTFGYLSYAQQKDFYENQVSLRGKEEASKSIPKPGFSENQTGLAFDVTDTANGNNNLQFKDTTTFKWLCTHAHEFGFILRYPENKEKFTDYNFMPWHWRFVGIDTAQKMFAKGGVNLTFEEYFQIQK